MRKLLFWALIGLLGYYAYEIIKVQTSAPFKAYKAYCLALLDDDSQRAKAMVIDQKGLEPFKYAKARALMYAGKRRFIYYWVLTEDGSEQLGQMSLRVEQTVRLDGPGENSFFGERSVQDTHYVELKQTGSGVWKIASFEDEAMRGG